MWGGVVLDTALTGGRGVRWGRFRRDAGGRGLRKRALDAGGSGAHIRWSWRSGRWVIRKGEALSRGPVEAGLAA